MTQPDFEWRFGENGISHACVPNRDSAVWLQTLCRAKVRRGVPWAKVIKCGNCMKAIAAGRKTA